MNKLEECTMSVKELYDMAFQKNPKKASDLMDNWEISDMTNHELITGL